MTRSRALRVALLLALAGAAVLRAGAGWVCPGGLCRVPPVDSAALAALHEWQGAALNEFFRVVTHAGSMTVLAPLALLCAAWEFRRGRHRAAAYVPLALGLAWLGARIAKALVLRPRPEVFAALVPVPVSASFPSGHAMQVTAFALACAWRPGLRPSAGTSAALAVLVALVCLSRPWLQVHYPSDVIAGALAAALWVAALRCLPVWSKSRDV